MARRLAGPLRGGGARSDQNHFIGRPYMGRTKLLAQMVTAGGVFGQVLTRAISKSGEFLLASSRSSR